jgi:hypothetical protein
MIWKGKSGLRQEAKILNIRNQYFLLEEKGLKLVFKKIFPDLVIINLNHLLKIAPNLIFLHSLTRTMSQ